MSEGIVQIYYGEGHGKSTAALGCAIRTAGIGKSVTVITFLKGKNEQEQEFLNRLEPEIKFFRFAKAEECFAELTAEKQQEEAMNLRNGFNYAKKVVTTGACDLVVLDEILGTVDEGVVSVDEMKELLANRPEDMTVICTGRVLPEGLRECADEIYNIAPEK
ncbi:MAG: cob(I)yrinic acid a,c-diamide adenosyltransferase [Clostridiales bacterium]|nr:cob(I)yrinic acid a,c-diamide adenosyltransferase [Clostridiales bacterium]